VNGTVWAASLVKVPNAVQTVLATHDTPAKRRGIGSIDQPRPWERAANGTPVPLLDQPTTVQATVDVHDTASKITSVAPRGMGAGTTDQRSPSQRSTNGSEQPAWQLAGSK
jgi:hypothetical protein